MRQIKLLLIVAAIMLCQSTMAATSGFGNIPKKVDYRDARITDVGVVAFDLMQWAKSLA